MSAQCPAVGSGGAPLTPALRARLMQILPNCAITDGFGSSETGAQGSQRLEAGTAPTAGVTAFKPYSQPIVVVILIVVIVLIATQWQFRLRVFNRKDLVGLSLIHI